MDRFSELQGQLDAATTKPELVAALNAIREHIESNPGVVPRPSAVQAIVSRNKALKDAGHGDLWPGEVATAAGRVLKLYTEGGSNNANDLRQPLAGGAAPLGRNNSLNLGGGAAGKTLGGGLGQSSSVRALAVPADDGADAAHVEVDVFGAEADEMRRELERLGLGAADLRRRARAALVRQAVMGTLYLAFFTICIVIGIGAQDKYCAEDIPGFLVIYGIFGIILQFGQFCMMILTFKVLRAQVEGGPGDTPPAMAAPPALAIPMACTNCGVFALAVFHLVWTIIGTVRTFDIDPDNVNSSALSACDETAYDFSRTFLSILWWVMVPLGCCCGCIAAARQRQER